MTTRLWILVLVVAAVGPSGCSRSTATADTSLKPALLDFAQFLEAIPGDGIKPPKKLAEFLPREPMAPVAAEHLQTGRMVYFWGAGLVQGGQRIIAYDKDVETSRGWVLLENGTVREMTTAEFAAAPKASSPTPPAQGAGGRQ